NIGGSKAISSDTSSKPKAYEFPTLKTQVDIDIMSMAWNTARIPRNDRLCDFEDCIDSSEAKKKYSDNSEVIEANDDTSDESFFLNANVDYSNVDLLVEGAKNTLGNA
ncbi:9206_t:CDS:2, partial [Gigaspora rosea]